MGRVSLGYDGEEQNPPPSIISPSILSADFANLAQECRQIIDQGADWLHVDIMDGHFVPNLTIGPPVVKSLRKHTEACLDCHLMVTAPEKWLKPLADGGADNFVYHIELYHQDGTYGTANPDCVQLMKQIQELGMNAGLAVKPSTPAEAVMPYIDLGLKLILILTVEPGFGGQKLMVDVLPKIKTLRDKYPKLYITVDGGVQPSNAAQVAEHGANVLVAGSAIFGADDPAKSILELRQALDGATKS